MSKVFPAFLIILFAVVSCNKKDEKLFTIGKADSLRSQVLNEDRKFFVYLPPSYNSGQDTTKRFPVVYLLDGGYHFHSVTGLLDQLTDNGLCPEMIVVAIQNTDRSRDLTPTKSLKLPNGETRDFLKSTGGADNFAKFIKTELFPHVEKKYLTAPHRTLIGHSFGGLFAVHILMTDPQMFNAYIAIDPSLWWDDRKLLNASDSLLQQSNFDNKSVFVSVANTMPAGMDTLMVGNDTTGNTSHIRSIIHFAKKANALKSTNGMNFNWKYYNEDSHGSVPLISEYDGLRYIFQFYRMNFDETATAEKYVAHFEMVSQKMGYEIPPPENLINQQAFSFLRKKNLVAAKDLFDLNLKNFPHSANAHECMGDYFLAAADSAQARNYFSRALAIEEVESTREKLEQLEK